MKQPTRHRQQFIRRANRVRTRIRGTAVRPRLAVFLGSRTTSAQLINDVTGHTVASASAATFAGSKSTVAAATFVGSEVAAAAKAANVSSAVFDRRGRQFHGRAKALADAARAAGLTL